MTHEKIERGREPQPDYDLSPVELPEDDQELDQDGAFFSPQLEEPPGQRIIGSRPDTIRNLHIPTITRDFRPS
jgi:hypothetical protein